MKKYVILIIVMLFIMVSCKKDDPIKPAKVVIQNEKVTEQITFYPCCGTMRVIEEPEPDEHFKPLLQLLLIEGKGTASIIGEYTVKNQVYMDKNGKFLTPITGYITCSNGNEIRTRVKSFYPDPENQDHMVYDYIVIGGSNCFLDATGWVKMHGSVDFNKMTWELSGEGEITY